MGSELRDEAQKIVSDWLANGGPDRETLLAELPPIIADALREERERERAGKAERELAALREEIRDGLRSLDDEPLSLPMDRFQAWCRSRECGGAHTTPFTHYNGGYRNGVYEALRALLEAQRNE